MSADGFILELRRCIEAFIGYAICCASAMSSATSNLSCVNPQQQVLETRVGAHREPSNPSQNKGYFHCV